MTFIPETEGPNNPHFGCIEDRITDVNVYQVPGCDLFFTSLRDIESVGSSTKSDFRLLDSVISDISNLDNYTLHKDSGHGAEYDGCGFAAKQAVIYTYLSENISELIERINSDKSDSIEPEFFQKIQNLASTAGVLAISGYFAISGGDLVSEAAQNGAVILSYDGEHTASSLVIDERDGKTYDPISANSDDSSTQTSFNVDTDNALVSRAKQFGLDGELAKAFAKVLSLATVDVLSGTKAPVSHR